MGSTLCHSREEWLRPHEAVRWPPGLKKDGTWRVTLVRVFVSICLAVCLVICLSVSAFAAPGDWPEPRQNAHLTGVQPMPGKMTSAPSVIASFDLGRSAPGIRAEQLREGGEWVGLALFAGELRCYDRHAQQVWRCHPAGLNFSKIEAVGDFDLDGDKEIALMAGRTADPFGAAVLVSLETGQVLWQYGVEPMSYAWYLYVDNYLPGVPTKQIVVVMHGYPPDKEFGYIALFDFPEKGKAPQQKWRYNFDHYTCFPSLLTSDIDGDGIKEIAIETHSRMWFIDVFTGVPKHFLMWDVSPANTRSYGLIDFVDLNKDGREDFLCIGNFAQHHEVLLNKGGRMEMAWTHGWSESVTTRHVATTWPELPYGDIDGDGRLEIVLTMYNSEGKDEWLICGYDAVTGELRYRQPGMMAMGLEDCDADGIPEILANVSDDPTETVSKGARLLKARDGKLDVVWQDDSARADRPANPKRHDPEKRIRAHFVRGDKAFMLERGSDGKYVEAPWTLREKKDKPDFAPLPAVVGPAPLPELLAVGGTEGNRLLLFQSPVARLMRLNGGALEPVAEFKSSCMPAAADFDGDGRPEIVTVNVSPDTQPVVEAFTQDAPAKSLWRKSLPALERVGFPHGRLAYIRTGRFTGKPTADLYVWAGTPLGRSLVLDGKTGEIVWEKGEFKGIERFWGATTNQASTYDYNGDGKEDLVFTAPDYYCVADGATGELLLGPLFPPNIFKQPSQALYTFPAVLDVKDGDPLVALVAGHYFHGVMTVKAEPRWYTLPEAGNARCAQEGFMRLADGSWLMGFARQNGHFACVNVSDGHTRWQLPVEASASDPATCDVDGDGQPEFVFGTSHGKLIAVGDGGDRPRVVWNLALEGGVGAPIAADLDGDGAVELATATTDGHVYVLGATKK